MSCCCGHAKGMARQKGHTKGRCAEGNTKGICAEENTKGRFAEGNTKEMQCGEMRVFVRGRAAVFLRLLRRPVSEVMTAKKD